MGPTREAKTAPHFSLKTTAVFTIFVLMMNLNYPIPPYWAGDFSIFCCFVCCLFLFFCNVFGTQVLKTQRFLPEFAKRGKFFILSIQEVLLSVSSRAS